MLELGDGDAALHAEVGRAAAGQRRRRARRGRPRSSRHAARAAREAGVARVLAADGARRRRGAVRANRGPATGPGQGVARHAARARRADCLTESPLDAVPPVLRLLSSQVSGLQRLPLSHVRSLGAALTALLALVHRSGRGSSAGSRTGRSARRSATTPPTGTRRRRGTPTMGGTLILFARGHRTLLWATWTTRSCGSCCSSPRASARSASSTTTARRSLKNPKGISARAKFLGSVRASPASRRLWLYSLPGFDSADLAAVREGLPPVDSAGSTCRSPCSFIVGTSNAVNLTDGLDGLAIGPTMTTSAVRRAVQLRGRATRVIASYLELTHIPGAGELAIFCAALIGAGIGFLWYNTYPAQVFMGDVGSLALGGALGMLAVLTKNELVLVIAGGLFVLEVSRVMIQVVSFKHARQAHVPHGADPSPLREEGLGRAEDHRPLLDHLGDPGVWSLSHCSSFDELLGTTRPGVGRRTLRAGGGRPPRARGRARGGLRPQAGSARRAARRRGAHLGRTAARLRRVRRGGREPGLPDRRARARDSRGGPRLAVPRRESSSESPARTARARPRRWSGEMLRRTAAHRAWAATWASRCARSSVRARLGRGRALELPARARARAPRRRRRASEPRARPPRPPRDARALRRSEGAAASCSGPDAWLVANRDDEWPRAVAKHAPAQVAWFSASARVDTGAVRRRRVTRARARRHRARAHPAGLAVQRRAAPARQRARRRGRRAISPARRRRDRAGAGGFAGLPHRVRDVCVRAGVRYVDDSKATNPAAAVASSSRRPRAWCGSRAGATRASTSRRSRDAARRARVRIAIVFGESALELERALRSVCRVERVGTLADAVTFAAASARPGDVVLLAPACASFDQFTSFEDRGGSLRELARALPGASGDRHVESLRHLAARRSGRPARRLRAGHGVQRERRALRGRVRHDARVSRAARHWRSALGLAVGAVCFYTPLAWLEKIGLVRVGRGRARARGDVHAPRRIRRRRAALDRARSARVPAARAREARRAVRARAVARVAPRPHG